jgi:C_GCAxxG_C_C family probable redox protein
MDRKEVERKTFEYHHSGFHCAEAIFKAIVEASGESPDPGSTKCASGFGGGIGGSHCDICGALTGGVAAVGWLFGRNDPCDDKGKVFSVTAEFRDLFLGKFGTTNCKAILESLGEQDNGLKCKRLTAEAAGMLHEILRREGGQHMEAQQVGR